MLIAILLSIFGLIFLGMFGYSITVEKINKAIEIIIATHIWITINTGCFGRVSINWAQSKEAAHHILIGH